MSVQEAKHTSQHAAGELEQKGEQASGQLQRKAQEASDKAEGRVRQEVDRRSQQLAEQFESAAQAIRKASEELHHQGKEQPANVMTQGAEKAEQLGRYLKRSDSDQLLRDAEEIARRKPWVTVAGGAAVGFALSRLVKASSAKRQQSSGGGHQQARADGESSRTGPYSEIEPRGGTTATGLATARKE